MKHIIYATLGATMFVPALIGCTEKTSDNKLKTIFVEQSFEKPDFDDLSSKIEVLEVFRPEFTDSTMFSLPKILKISDGKAYLHEGKWMAVYDYPSGKLENAFNRYGAGPEEYMYSYHKYYADGTWTVLDQNYGRYNIMQYAADGSYMRTVENDSIQSLSPIVGGGWLAYNDCVDRKNKYAKKRDKKVYQYDKDWNLSNIYSLNERRWGERGSDRMDAVCLYDGVQYVSDTDTIYKIDTEKHVMLPAIAMNLGKYSFDWGSLENYQEIRDAEKSHFYISTPVFNSRYMFATYTMKAEEPWVLYYDVYDIDNGELVYRHRLPLEGEYGLCQFFEGFPVELDSETVFGWPVNYVDDDAFYVIVATDELARIYDTDAINPVFVKIRIKD
ncbi:MAG: 6-bladed beta-propeller [Muribaculaceae bacterium]|nr:6-bladed beta-propeller [Muribaculaceae bacterium]